MAVASKGAPPEFLSTHPSGSDRISQMNNHMGQVLPLYARTKGLGVDALPPYRSNVVATR
jgi:predicted Zn-dependent protease